MGELVSRLAQLLSVPDVLICELRPMPNGWEYGNDVDRAMLAALEIGDTGEKP